MILGLWTDMTWGRGSADPDQPTLKEAVWSRSTVFAILSALFWNIDIWATSWENLLRYMQTTMAQISLHIRAVWSAPLLFAA